MEEMPPIIVDETVEMTPLETSALITGSGAVSSVNGKTGAVVLTAPDVGAPTVGELNAEVAARTQADRSLKAQITSETTARQSADAELNAAITNEATTRANADTVLRNSITDETIARQDADTALRTAINAEKTARQNADTALQTAIDNEATARQNADTTLRNAINAEAVTRAEADALLVPKTRKINDKTLDADITLDAADVGAIATADIVQTTGDNTGKVMSQNAVTTALSGKQDNLTAGDNITIESNTISATDTTYNAFTGTDGTSAGVAGLVPAPTTDDVGKFLKANGTWAVVQGGSGSYTAGNGLNLQNNEFSIDTTVVATVAELADKVDKETGKGLSTNDFTDALKTKLEGVEAGAEVNVQSDWNEADDTADDYIKNKPQNLVTDANYVHTDNNFTDALKTKLDGVASGAEVNVQSNWTEADSTSDAFILNKPQNLVTDANYVHTDNNFTDALKNKLEGVESGAEVNVQADWDEADSTADSYIQNKPTGLVTDVDYVHTDNNFTDALKTKLEGVASGAEVNVQSDWAEADSSSDAFIKNKPALATVATTGAYSDLIGTPSPYSLPIASANDLGGIKVGSNLSIDANGVLSAAGDAVSSVNGKTGAVVLGYSDVGAASTSALTSEETARQNADNNLQGQIDAITASSDVTDVVGTYAQLQAYDTSTLNNNDIIKVLQDESQNDETTYYRWSTTNHAFTLIGEEGPYYTKSETNALLDDKVDKVTDKGLSTNDFTDALKTKLDGIASDAEVNVQANWTESDNTSDAYIQNKPNLATVATTGAYSDLTGTPSPYTLPIASANDLGGIKVGNNLTIDSSGVLSATGAGVAVISSADWSALWQ